MDIHPDTAEKLFLAGYNCCQSVLAAYCEDRLFSDETALMLSSGFGGGLGRQRMLCGAVSGMCMAYGLLRGYSEPDNDEEKKRVYETIQKLCAEFEKENGSLICAELLNEKPTGIFSQSEKRTTEYYESRPCAKLVRSAALILDKNLRD